MTCHMFHAPVHVCFVLNCFFNPSTFGTTSLYWIVGLQRQKLFFTHKLPDRYTSRVLEIKIREANGTLIHVASAGCFPGTWHRNSWHYQSRQFATAINRKPVSYSRFMLYASFLSMSEHGRLRVPPAKRSGLYYTTGISCCSAAQAEVENHLLQQQWC